MNAFPDPGDLRKAADGVEAANKASEEASKKDKEAKAANAAAEKSSTEAAKALAKVTPAAGRGGNGNPRKPLVLGADGNDGVRKAILLGIAVIALIALVTWLAILTGTKANNSEVSAVKQIANTTQTTANEAKADAKSAKEVANKAISEASEAKADAASSMSTAKEAKTIAEKCNCQRDCIKRERIASSPKQKPKAKPRAKPVPQPKAVMPPKAKCTDCVPHEVPRKLSEIPRNDGRCFVQAQSGSYKYKFELRHETRTGRLMIGLVDSNDQLRPGTKAIYLGNEMSVVNTKGVDCDGNQARLYANWSLAKEAFQLPSACELIARKP